MSYSFTKVLIDTVTLRVMNVILVKSLRFFASTEAYHNYCKEIQTFRIESNS